MVICRGSGGLCRFELLYGTNKNKLAPESNENMKKIIITIIAALFFTTAAMAQDKVWTLQDCIKYAVENNISLKQTRNSYLSGLEDTEQAKAAMFPSISASSSQGFTNRPFTDTGSSTVVGSNVYSTNANSYTGSYNVNAGMTLFGGGSLRTALKQKKVQNAIDSLSIEESANSIIIAIVQAYMQCLYATEAITISQSTAEAAKAQVDRAQEMKNTGELSKVDVAQLESQYASDLYQVTTAKISLDNYKLQLKQLLELDVNEDIYLATPSVDEAQVLKLLPSKAEVCENALAAMPEIQRGQLTVDAAELSIAQAKSGYSPTLSANAGIGTTSISGSGNSFTDQIQKNLNESIGLSLSIPILQGRKNKTAVNKAKIAADNSILEQKSIEKTLLKSVENTYLDAVSSQSQYLSAKEQQKYAEQSYELTSEQFGVGLKNTVELITAQNSLLTARQQLLQCKYMALMSNTLLDIYQGNKNIEQ